MHKEEALMFGLMRKSEHVDTVLRICDAHDEAIEEVRQDYQRKLDAEFNRVLGLCRTQLHRWAADGFYELFTTNPTALTGVKLRGMFEAAEKMLSPEKLKL
jgi:hypothetical protein